MKCQIIIDENCEERVLIYARRESGLTEQIRLLAEQRELLGYNGKETVKLEPSDIYCIAIIGSKTYAICEKERFQLKQRLYQLEETLPDCFVKINQSAIANIHKLQRFDASITGTLKLTFRNGYVDYVSRRQVKGIKERMGI